MKRIVAVFMIFVMISLLIPISTTAIVAEHDDIPSNSKTFVKEGVEYTVIRKESDFPTTGFITKRIKAGNYILANDLNFNGKSVSNSYLFKTFASGNIVLDGNGYSIYGYSISSDKDCSTFGVENHANFTIRNLTLGKKDAPISLIGTKESISVGAVFCQATGTFLLQNVTAYVNINSTNCFEGGLLGFPHGEATLIDCNVYGTKPVRAVESSDRLTVI